MPTARQLIDDLDDVWGALREADPSNAYVRLYERYGDLLRDSIEYSEELWLLTDVAAASRCDRSDIAYILVLIEHHDALSKTTDRRL